MRNANMPVQVLEHVTIRCADLKATRDFYVEMLGLAEGARPDFPFRGHWLYLGGIPVVHLVDAHDKASAWGGEPGAAERDTGPFDHVAFRGDDFGRMRGALAAAGVDFRERVVPGGALSQLFVRDPDGVLVEINFRN
jgi:catechol 2,3-dioxygenase-like lactoylglutathione lyase family enzyme